MLDLQTARRVAGRQYAAPYARRSIIGGHAERAGIMPELAVHDAREWQAAMARQHAVAAAGCNVMQQHAIWRGREDEAARLARRAMHDGKLQAVDRDVEAKRQRT